MTNATLTERGEAALRAAAPLWRRLNLRPDVVLSSPLPRALRTAELFCEAIGGARSATTGCGPEPPGATSPVPWRSIPRRGA